MAQQNIDIGSSPGDGTGDTPKEVGDKVNNNFDELYGDKVQEYEAVNLADDATHEFTTVGLDSNFNLCIIGVAQTPNAQAALFYSLTGSNIQLGVGGGVSVGTDTNPDTDGDLNVWVNTSNNTIQVKNRLGGTRDVYLIRIGRI